MNMTQVKQLVKRCEGELNSIGIELPKGIQYRTSARMTRALGNFRETRQWGGSSVSKTITISSDLPFEVGHETMMHEMLHAILGVSAGHGPRFQQLARTVNAKLGYHIGTYANATEAKAIREVRANKPNATTNLVCNSCGKVHTISSRKKAARMPQNFRCRCGGSLRAE